MNDGESKDGNISAESSIFGRKKADQQGSFSVFVPPLTYKNNPINQICKEIETKHLILSGFTVFWDSRSHYQRYTTVHLQNNKQTWTRL